MANNVSPYDIMGAAKDVATKAGPKQLADTIVGLMDLLERLIRTGRPVSTADIKAVTSKRKASKATWDAGEPAKAKKR